MISNRTDLAPLVPIADFCETGSGGTPSRAQESLYFGGPIPWVKSGELRENTICKMEETITALGLKESAAKRLPRGTLLVALYWATVGRVGILGIEAATNQAVCHIIPDQRRADRQYLFYALQAQVPTWLSRRVGGGQPNISQGIIRETLIPLPPLGEQKRIAYLLNKVEGLIAQRKQHLQQLDDLLKSVFLDMFGDPTSNVHDWEVEKLKHLTGEKIGYGIVQPGQPVEDGVPVIRVGDFVGTQIHSTNITMVTNEVSEKHKTSILKGDEILLACVGATIGKVALVEPKHKGHNIVRATARIRTSDRVGRLFLAHYLLSEFAQRYYSNVTRAVGQPTLNIKQIEELLVAVPPMPLQIAFAMRVEAIETLRTRLQDSLNLLENLFDILSQQAFNGELDLSRVNLPVGKQENHDETETTEPMDDSVDDQLFELPAPADVKKLKSAQGRKTVLKNWLTAYTKHLGKAPIAAESFLELVQQKLSELESIEDLDGYSHEIGVAEYDQIKDWIFQNRESGELTPEYNDTENQVRASAAKD